MKNTDTTDTNLDTAERVLRVTVTMGLIAAVLNYNGTLGYLTLIPLFAIYTGITAAIGWDPIDALVKAAKLRKPASRIDASLAH